MSEERQKSIPSGVWALGFVSLLMDVSSEMIHSLLPLFLTAALGADAAVVGLIEGLGEATALIVKVFSGALSDWLGQRKRLAISGYLASALTKPLFAIATGPGLALAARVLDRIGKGVRGAPRDALIADLTPPEILGAAFGLRQSLDTVGAFLGPLVAAGLMLASADNFRLTFWVAFIPALGAVAWLAIAVREPAHKAAGQRRNPISAANLRRLGPSYWRLVAIGGFFSLARFSEAFLLLRAEQKGVSIALTPLVLVAMNVVYAVAAYPIGKLSDRISREKFLPLGLLALVAADLCLAEAPHWGLVLVGVLFWGLHLALTQGLFSAMIADVAPPDLRGSAFGFFNLVGGLALLCASVGAGLLWDYYGAASTFLFGAAISVLTLIALYFLPRSRAAES